MHRPYGKTQLKSENISPLSSSSHVLERPNVVKSVAVNVAAAIGKATGISSPC